MEHDAKIRLRLDELAVDTFAAVAPEDDAGTVVAHEQETTLPQRRCVTQAFDCSAQGGYTCDYGWCVPGWTDEC